jgi:hypothetical protein
MIDGTIYSIGQYRPKKMGFHEQFVFPMKIKLSEFSSPDLCEFWTGSYTTLSIEINETQFLLMKEQIERDQQKKEHFYQLFEDNCVSYAMNIARIGGIQFPTRIPLSELLITSRKIKTLSESFMHSEKVPAFLKNAARHFWVVGLNWVSVVLGAGMIDSEVGLFCTS